MALRAALLALPFDAVPPLPEELSEETETSETRQPNTSSSKSVRSKDALTVSAMSICTKVCGDASSSVAVPYDVRTDLHCCPWAVTEQATHTLQ